MFSIEPDDKGLSIILKREANIILASLLNDTEKAMRKIKFNDALRVIKAIEFTDPQNAKDIDDIINTVNNIWYKGVLTSLTLKDNEFNPANDKGIARNIRYNAIYKLVYDGITTIFNDNAYNIVVTKVYDITNKRIAVCNDKIETQLKIYLTKGGAVTGEYVQHCIIKKEYIDKHEFVIETPTYIPVAIIQTPDCLIYVTDYRNVELNSLKDKYNIVVNYDATIENKKLDIRKLKKICHTL